MIIEIIEHASSRVLIALDDDVHIMPRNSERLVLDGDVYEVCDTVYNYDNNRIEVYVNLSKRFYLHL